MNQSPLRLVKRCIEYQPRDKVPELDRDRRGIYVLYDGLPNRRFDVVYIGMARTGARGRLKDHFNKKDGWTHFSIFEVWDNVRDAELEELEGLFRHIYRKDGAANRLNVQKSFGKLQQVRTKDFRDFALDPRPIHSLKQ